MPSADRNIQPLRSALPCRQLALGFIASPVWSSISRGLCKIRIDCMIEQEERRRFHSTPFQKRATIVSYVVHLLAGGARVPAKDIIGHLCSEKSAPIADSESVGHPGKEYLQRKWRDGIPERTHRCKSFADAVCHQPQSGAVSGQLPAVVACQVDRATHGSNEKGVRL